MPTESRQLLGQIRNEQNTSWAQLRELLTTFRLQLTEPGLLLRVTSIAKVINLNAFLPAESALQPEGLLHTRGMAASGLRPLCNIPHCCLP